MKSLLNPFFRLVDLCLAEMSPSDIARAITAGMWLALIPKATLQWALLLLLSLVIRMNLFSLLISALVFTCLCPIADRVSHSLGLFLLSDFQQLHPLFAWMFHAPIVPFTRFYNTIALGSFLLCLAMSWPVFRICKQYLQQNQARHLDRLFGSIFWARFEETYIFHLYDQYTKQRRA